MMGRTSTCTHAIRCRRSGLTAASREGALLLCCSCANIYAGLQLCAVSGEVNSCIGTSFFILNGAKTERITFSDQENPPSNLTWLPLFSVCLEVATQVSCWIPRSTEWQVILPATEGSAFLISPQPFTPTMKKKVM